MFEKRVLITYALSDVYSPFPLGPHGLYKMFDLLRYLKYEFNAMMKNLLFKLLFPVLVHLATGDLFANPEKDQLIEDIQKVISKQHACAGSYREECKSLISKSVDTYNYEALKTYSEFYNKRSKALKGTTAMFGLVSLLFGATNYLGNIMTYDLFTNTI